MSRPKLRQPMRPPLIALVHRANRELQADMVRNAQMRGFPEARMAHNAVFGTLGFEPARAADLAVSAGITRQSMGEVIRELVDLGILEMTPDPTDRRAKLVSYTEFGRKEALEGSDYIVSFEERLTELLGEEGYEQLRTGLEKVYELLRADAEAQ
jgi:DNA-binding MarR family transcriptional regulator